MAKNKGKNMKKIAAAATACFALATPMVLTGCSNEAAEPGTKWLTGIEVPTSANGRVGDFYLDTDDFNIYQKDNEGWKLVGSLKGEQGEEGSQGEAGVGIESITKTSSINNVDTYTILFTDGSNSTFTVTNGNNGNNGLDGADGITPHVGQNGNWWVGTTDLGVKAAGTPGKSAYEIWKEHNPSSTKTEAEWLESLKGSNGQDGAPGSNGQDGAPGADGEDGKSAYEIWKEHHPTSDLTEAEWLETLKGSNGQDGAPGSNGQDGAPGADGEDGKSAYEIWKEYHPTSDLTEEEWLETLKGSNGQDGAPGSNGQDGAPGTDGQDGEKGDKGDKGDQGLQGVGILKVESQYGFTSQGKTCVYFTIYYTDGTQETITSIIPAKALSLSLDMNEQTWDYSFKVIKDGRKNTGLTMTVEYEDQTIEEMVEVTTDMIIGIDDFSKAGDYICDICYAGAIEKDVQITIKPDFANETPLYVFAATENLTQTMGVTTVKVYDRFCTVPMTYENETFEAEARWEYVSEPLSVDVKTAVIRAQFGEENYMFTVNSENNTIDLYTPQAAEADEVYEGDMDISAMFPPEQAAVSYADESMIRRVKISIFKENLLKNHSVMTIEIDGQPSGIPTMYYGGTDFVNVMGCDLKLDKDNSAFEQIENIEALEAVVHVNGVACYSFKDAIINAIEGSTITLNQDIDLNEQINIYNKITIDLNGCTISNSLPIWDDTDGIDTWSLLSVQAGGDLTIEGEYQGRLQTIDGDCYAVDVRDGGKLTINSGTYVGNISAIYVHEGTAVINGGNFDIQQLSKYDDYRYLINCYDESLRNETAKVVIKGGEFKNYNPALSASENPLKNFLPEGYKVIEKQNMHFDENDYYIVKKVNPEIDYVMNNGTAYESIHDAIEAAEASSTVRLLQSIEISSDIVISKDIKIDLNGYTITATHDGAAFAISSGNVYIDNGTIDAYGDGVSVVAYTDAANVYLGSELTITAHEYNCLYVKGAAVSVETYADMTTYSTRYATIQGNGLLKNRIVKLHILGGNIINAGGMEAIYAPQTGELVIENAYLEGTTAVYIKSGNVTLSNSTFVANGEKIEYEYNGNGSTAGGDAVIIDACAYPGGNPTVTIEGGSYSSANGYGIVYYQFDGNEATITNNSSEEIHEIKIVKKWTGEVAAVPEATEANVISITSAEELAGLAKAVNEGNTFEGYTIVLTKDLDLNNVEWTPIGYGLASYNGKSTTGASFKGIFDGNNKTIYNLKISEFNQGGKEEGTSAGIGLFGTVVKATISDLSINGAYVKGNHNVGTLVGWALNTNIEEVVVSNSTVDCVYANSEESGDKAGAIVGHLADGGKWLEGDSSIQNCTVIDCNVLADRDAGQLMGGKAASATETGNTITNVTVSWNESGSSEKSNTNIKNEAYGRVSS